MTARTGLLQTSFRTKVLVPVVIVMVLLLAISMWPVNRRITQQLQDSAAQQVVTAQAALKITQQTRANDLFLRYSSAINEPRFKAGAEMLNFGKSELNQEQRNTLSGFLDDFIKEELGDAVMLTPHAGRPLIVNHDSRFSAQKFETSCAPSVRQALDGESSVNIVLNDDRLFDIVTIPISVSGTIVGAITFGVKNSMAQEFERLTQSELVLLIDGKVVASTLRNASLASSLPLGNFSQLASQTQKPNEIRLGDEHFFYLTGWMGAENDPHRLGYFILSSYEKPLQTLQTTQRMILVVSLLAILSGTAIVWFLVSRVTRPLRELRDSAEAVGRGDFSRRVPVRSKDECGELANVFNQMTENIRHSRAELEKTVVTLKGTQAQLVQSEKLSAVGEFVAGVAHELNNPLATVMGFSELIKDADVGEKNKRHLDSIFKSAQRCQKIVQSLLSFARRHKPERKPVPVNPLIEAVLEIVAYPLRTSNIEVETQLDAELPAVLADEHQVQQVLLNIVNNARQAIESHQAGGKIKISTGVAGPNIRITIQDNGPGISPENLSRIFDPFFTTKDVGKGTGLGLSLCYGIIKEHGGEIKVVSESGRGAAFVIELPVARGQTSGAEALLPAEKNGVNPREGAGKKVLVIDDEEIILEMIQESLSRSGYQVETVTDGESGLHRLKQNHYDVALCDWKMPGLNGRQIYERLLATNPELCKRVIFVTGDVINDRMREFLKAENRPCLSKPFALAELRAAVKLVLEPGAPRG